MSRPIRFAIVVVALGVVVGCAAKRLPPGTPPPEYETRELPPWSGDVPDAAPAATSAAEPPLVEGAPAPAELPSEQPKSEPASADAGPGPSPDAGVR